MFTTFTRTAIATAVIASALAIPTATATPATPTPAPLSPRVEATDATLISLTPMTPAWAKAVDSRKSDYARISAEEAGYASIPQIGCHDPLAYWDHAERQCLRVVP